MKVPPLVERARASRDHGDGTTDDTAGSLLHVLAASRGVRRAAEIGTGLGDASAWIATALPPGVPLYVVEPGEALAAAASALFADDPDVHVLAGDWRVELPTYAPFDFVHVAADDAKNAVDEVVSLAAPRATLVLDVPTSESRDRELPHARWLDNPRLDTIVIASGPVSDVLVAVVRG